MGEFSLKKVIKNDFVAFLYLVVGPVALVVVAFEVGSADLSGARDNLLWAGAAVTTVVAWAALTRRVHRVRRVLSAGLWARARVTAVRFHKNGGRLELQYEHDGESFHMDAAIMKNAETLSFSAGDQLDVALDPSAPSRAYVVSLYSA